MTTHKEATKSALALFCSQESKGLWVGARAALRRWSPGRLPSANALAFMVGKLDAHVTARDADKLFAALQLVALLADQHDYNARVGSALAEAGLSQLRLERLLRARDEALIGELRRAARMLAAKGTRIHTLALTDLLFTDQDAYRLRIAQDYYRTARTEQETTHA